MCRSMSDLVAIDRPMMSQKTRPITWRQLVALEPRLTWLLAAARGTRDTGETPSFCANAVWLEDFKPMLNRLVGWGAWRRDPVLRSSAAYDLAYGHIYAALPDCRECLCCSGET